MLIIYCDIYRRKCRTVVYFRFACSNFDGHFKGQDTFFQLMCIERSAILQFSEILNPKEPGIKKKHILVNIQTFPLVA